MIASKYLLHPKDIIELLFEESLDRNSRRQKVISEWIGILKTETHNWLSYLCRYD